MTLKQLQAQQQKQLECLLSYVQPREYEVVEESSLTVNLLNQGLLLADEPVRELGNTKVQLWNIHLSLSGQEWIVSHTTPSMFSQIGKTLTRFGWLIIGGIITLIGSLIYWWTTQQS